MTMESLFCNDFVKQIHSKSKTTYKAYSKEEFIQIMKPIICQVCRDLFSGKFDENNVNIKDIEPFEWQVIL